MTDNEHRNQFSTVVVEPAVDRVAASSATDRNRYGWCPYGKINLIRPGRRTDVCVQPPQIETGETTIQNPYARSFRKNSSSLPDVQRHRASSVARFDGRERSGILTRGLGPHHHRTRGSDAPSSGLTATGALSFSTRCRAFRRSRRSGSSASSSRSIMLDR